MSDYIKVVLIGVGKMGKAYCKVLQALDCTFDVIGRGEESAGKFKQETGIDVLPGGIDNNLDVFRNNAPTHAIIAVNIEELAKTTKRVLELGIKNILLEKPGAVDKKKLSELCRLAQQKKATIYIAYNRRFYASTQKAKEIINEDGGVTSFFFEFTEWGHVIKKSSHTDEEKAKWFLANSTHVVDLAFFLGGEPELLFSLTAGKLDWHQSASKYVGAGNTKAGALFSYMADWNAPGRWSVEVLTPARRLYLKPLEKLQMQRKGSVTIENIEIDDQWEKEFKPGLYNQTKYFINNIKDEKFITIKEQLERFEKIYEKIDKNI